MTVKKFSKLNDDIHKLWSDPTLKDIRVSSAEQFGNEKEVPLQGVRRKEYYGEPSSTPSKKGKIDKTASINKEAGFDMDFAQTQFYSPRLTSETWYLPKSRKMLLRWVKIFFDWDPYISSILRMHARYPISEFKLNCSSIKQEEFYDAVLHQDNWDIMDTLRIGSLSMYKYGECLVGSTKIKLLNGKDKTLKELCDSGTKNFGVYSINAKNEIVPGKASEVKLTRNDAEVLKITLDNNTSFKCTPDHLVMLRDGSYSRADELKTNATLMPLYTKQQHVYYKMQKSAAKYEKVYNPATGIAEDVDGKAVSTAVYKNHKVISIERCQNEDVYDIICVDKYHNFAISFADNSGIFVHNCVQMGSWNEKYSIWDYYTDLDPALIEVESVPFSNQIKIYAEIPEKYKKLWKQSGVAAEKAKAAIPKEMAACIDKGMEYIELETTEEGIGKNYSPSRVFFAANKSDVGESGLRGLPPITCLSGDTHIALLDGTNPTLKEMYDRNDTDFELYSIDEDNNIIRGRGEKVVKTVVEPSKIITLDNGAKVTSTFSHRFMLRDGKYCRADELKVGDAMMPLYRKIREVQQTPEYLEKLSRSQLAVWANPGYLAKMKLVRKEQWAVRKAKMNLTSPMTKEASYKNHTIVAIEDGPIEQMYCIQNAMPSHNFMITFSDGSGICSSNCLMRDLVFKDHLKKAQFERAKRFAYPIEIWKLGDVGKEIIPTGAELKNIQQMLRESLSAPPFSIVYTPLLSLEIIGATGALLDIYKDLEFVENNMLVGLGTNKNIVLGEGGWMGAAKTLSMQRLLMDYSVDREMWERKFIRGHVLRALCMAHGAVKNCPITNLKRPDIPKVSWLRSLDIVQEEDNKKLARDMWKDGTMSTKTLYSKFPDLDYEVEARNLEAEKGTVFDDGKRLPKSFAPVIPEDTSGGTLGAPTVSDKPPNPPSKPEAPEKPVKEEATEVEEVTEEKPVKE